MLFRPHLMAALVDRLGKPADQSLVQIKCGREVQPIGRQAGEKNDEKNDEKNMRLQA